MRFIIFESRPRELFVILSAMSEEVSQPKSNDTKSDQKSDQKPDEISLAEIDRLISEDDPEFANQLNEIKEVGAETDIEIESAVAIDDQLATDTDDGHKSKLLQKFPFLEKIIGPLKKLKEKFYTRWLKAKNRIAILGKQAWLYSKTLPREFARYSKSMALATINLIKKIKSVIFEMTHLQRFTWLLLLASLSLAIWVVKLNIGGVWLPGIGRTNISDMTKVADKVWGDGEETEFVSLFKAFPQEEIEFLFPKIIVNLKRANGGQNPMGAFEFFVVLDSQDAALEVKARTAELHDRLQRALEDQLYNDLASPLGKKRFKDVLRKELNEVLTQGWVKDVLIKTMVLKP